MIKTFNVASRGIGRKDYSLAVEYASQPALKGWQARNNWALDYEDVPTLPYDWAYVIYLGFFDAEGVLHGEVPSGIVNHIYYVGVTSSRKALVVAALYEFASLDDYWAWIVESEYGYVSAYGVAELVFTNGINTKPGRVYAVMWTEYSEKPTFDMRITVNALEEQVIL